MSSINSKEWEKRSKQADKAIASHAEALRNGGMKSGNLVRGHDRFKSVFAAVGVLAVSALAAGGILYFKDKAKNEKGRAAAESLCDISVSAAQKVSPDACVRHVTSGVPFPPRNPNVTTPIDGVVSYSLSENTRKGALPDGAAGAGLYVHIDGYATNRYQDTADAIESPDIKEGDSISPYNIITGFYPLVAAGGDGGAFASEKCSAELNLWFNAVVDNPADFAVDDFTPSVIARSINKVNFAPYLLYDPNDPTVAAKPLPALPTAEHTEIIFTATYEGKEWELKCPTPVV